MSWANKLIPFLPDRWQDRIMARVIASGQWKRVPTFHMLFESYVLLGADRNDLLKVFSSAKDFAQSFYENCRSVARQREETAGRMANNAEQCRTVYQKALMLYFLADWVSFEEQQIAENYADLLRTSAKIDALGRPKTEKVYFPWPQGQIAARFRYPDLPETPAGGYPAVILLQGNDTVKETLLIVEDELLRNGFAVLNVDQPGWGESRLSGNRYNSLEDARLLVERCISFFIQDPLTNAEKVAVFGFSGGGTWAVMAASVSQQIRWMVTFGGAIYNLGESVRALPAMQKRQCMKHWGCTEKEITGIIHDISLNDLVPRIQARCLVVHGEKDTLVPLQNTQTAAKLIAGPVELRIVPGGDHMCTATLREEEIPYIMSWLSAEMKSERANVRKPDGVPL